MVDHDLIAPADPEPGRRERKKRQTRDALERAALHLFMQRGFDETTVEAITEAADVARRTFFRYFDSKEAVLFAHQDDVLQLLVTALDGRPPGEPVIQSVRAALRVLAAHQVDESERNLALARIALHAPTVSAHAADAQQRWEAAVSRWIADRLDSAPEDMRPLIIAGATVAALRAALSRWVNGGGVEDPSELVDESFNLLEKDFGLPAGT